jgi:3-isopropylmalate/(R)-2-methylmalate dehydratase small subunit
MTGISILKARAVPLDMANVDTDRIIPARFLKQRRGAAYRDFLFHDCRFTPEGRRIDEFPLNRPAYEGARILVADANFGIGSAREGAVWALQAFGIGAVIAAGFGDVFRANCIKNAVLPVSLGHEETTRLRQQLLEAPGSELTIDLVLQTVTAAEGSMFPFAMDPFEKRMLIEGLDELAITSGYMQGIEAFERSYHSSRPWLRRQVGS